VCLGERRRDPLLRGQLFWIFHYAAWDDGRDDGGMAKCRLLIPTLTPALSTGRARARAELAQRGRDHFRSSTILLSTILLTDHERERQ